MWNWKSSLHSYSAFHCAAGKTVGTQWGARPSTPQSNHTLCAWVPLHHRLSGFQYTQKKYKIAMVGEGAKHRFFCCQLWTGEYDLNLRANGAFRSCLWICDNCPPPPPKEKRAEVIYSPRAWNKEAETRPGLAEQWEPGLHTLGDRWVRRANHWTQDSQAKGVWVAFLTWEQRIHLTHTCPSPHLQSHFPNWRWRRQGSWE